MDRPSSDLFKKITGICILVVSALLIGLIFWRQELKYSLPTQIPAQYEPVPPGSSLELPSFFVKNNAYFLHFYNPECPCSRFNARHIQSLIRDHQDSIKFVIIIPHQSFLAKAQKAFGTDLEYLSDPDHDISKTCGVYSTPQAAIISRDQKLYYRGNYNRARYCTSRASNFAELSLIALINNKPAPVFGLLATTSYGCELNGDESEIIFF